MIAKASDARNRSQKRRPMSDPKLKVYRIAHLKSTPELRNELDGKEVVVYVTKGAGYFQGNGKPLTAKGEDITVFHWIDLWKMIQRGQFGEEDRVIPIKDYIKIPILETENE